MAPEDLNFEKAKYYFNEGLSALKIKKYDQAEKAFINSLNFFPGRSSTLSNLAAVQIELEKYEAALNTSLEAVETDPKNCEAWLNCGVASAKLHKFNDALNFFSNAIKLSAKYSEAHVNYGNVLLKLRRFKEALKSINDGISCKPDNVGAYFNLGNVLRELGKADEALAAFDKALSFNPDYAEAYVGRGDLLHDQKLYPAALLSYQLATLIRPDFDYLPGKKLHTQMLLCDWKHAKKQIDKIGLLIKDDRKAIAPFSFLGLLDDPFLQLKAAMIAVNEKYSLLMTSNDFRKKDFSGKIRIGHYSPDFRKHAVAFLTAGMFEAHDRDKFELIAFSFRSEPEDSMQQRLKANFDRFIDVSAMSDLEVAQLSREIGVDIAVDLAGHTGDARQQIFAYRAAPVQVSYLGYPGTSGITEMDYIIADRVVISSQYRQAYSENVIYLPHCFQVNDNTRVVPSQQMERQQLGLPAGQFVFCCMNNTHKVNPTMFASWMRILGKTRGTVLWLLAETELVASNLRSAALEHGISKDRLVLTARLEPEDYLASLACADLFLDTLPFNAGTTASDALWAGLPLLTCQGKSFAARMASSILQAADLGELVTTSLEEYEALAIELANNPERMAALRQRLNAGRKTAPLFNTQQTTRHIEQAFELIHQRRLRGEPAQDIRIPA